MKTSSSNSECNGIPDVQCCAGLTKHPQHKKKKLISKWNRPSLNAAKFTYVFFCGQGKKSVIRITKLIILCLYELTRKVYMKHKLYKLLHKITI